MLVFIDDCHMATFDTMANGDYGRIMSNFMGELLSPLGNRASMAYLALAVSLHICLTASL